LDLTPETEATAAEERGLDPKDWEPLVALARRAVGDVFGHLAGIRREGIPPRLGSW
jgi:hypothetical protein